MKTYQAKFTGRTLGAIGIFYKITTTAKGNTEAEARENLYQHYEHLSGLTLKEIPEKGTAMNWHITDVRGCKAITSETGKPLVYLKPASAGVGYEEITQLLESAPELLEACQHALDQLDDLAVPDFIHGMDCPGGESCVICELRSVISKAKGE